MEKVDIKGFENYQITDEGNVWSKKTNRWLKFGKTIAGYYFVILRKDGKSYNKMIHRLIAQAFIPNPDNKPCIDHINAVRTDNRIENLRWSTYTENNNNPITRKRMSIGSTGKKASEETRKKMSEIRKGKKYGKHSQ